MHCESVALDAFGDGDRRLIIVFLKQKLTLVDLLCLVDFTPDRIAVGLGRLLAKIGASLEA